MFLSLPDVPFFMPPLRQHVISIGHVDLSSPVATGHDRQSGVFSITGQASMIRPEIGAPPLSALHREPGVGI